MTHHVLRISAVALGAATILSFAPLSAARADTSAEPAPTPTVSAPASSPTPTAAAPSLSEPAPTPLWAEAPRNGATAAAQPHRRHYARHYTRHYASREGRRYAGYDNNPVTVAVNGVAGGVADLGSIAAYPIYCFPNYGSCRVHWYR